MSRIHISIALFLLLLLVGCDNSTIENPGYVTTIVDSVKHVYWNKGLYKLNVFYRFKVGDTQKAGMHVHKFEHLYTRTYAEGDSVLIVYDKENLKRNRIKRITDKKVKIKL